MNARPVYRAPIEPWPQTPDPTTVRRWPVRLDGERGYHDPARGGRHRLVPAAEILEREGRPQ